jgi:hypothetical protein
MIKNYSEFKKYLALANKKRRIMNALTFSPFFILTFLTPLMDINFSFHIILPLIFMATGGFLFKEAVIDPAQLSHLNFNIPKLIKQLDNYQKKPYSLVDCYDLIFSFFLAAQYSELKHHQKNDSFVHSCLFNIEQLRQGIDYNQQALKNTSFDSTHSIQFPNTIQEKFDEYHQYICTTFHHLISGYLQEKDYLEKSDFDLIMKIEDTEKIKMIEQEINSIYDSQARHDIEKIEIEQKWGILQEKPYNQKTLKALSL